MSALVMSTEFGIYVDGAWHVWLQGANTDHHGWKSPSEAVAYWSSPERAHRFTPYLNGRETPWGHNTGGVTVDGEIHVGQIMQRVWFEGDPEVGQLAFDFATTGGQKDA